MGGVGSIALVLKSMNCLFLFALLTDIGSQQLKAILPSSMGVMIFGKNLSSYRIICGQSKILIRFFQKINMLIPHHKSDVEFQERPVLPNFTFRLFLKIRKCFFQKSSSETFTFFFEIILVLTFMYSFFIVKKQEVKEVKILKTKPQLEKKV